MSTISNFYYLISEKTKDFVGRKWVFDEIDNWLNDEDQQNKSKYFIVTGKAGSGKSTISAKLIEISNGDVKENNLSNNDENIHSTFKKLKKGFLDASYVISFKDNLSTDAKTLAKSISSQLASKYDEFAQELINLTKSSNMYNIDINASEQQINERNISGDNFTINISSSPSAVFVFNDLVRNPLESFLLKNNSEKKMVFLIDGLDESVTSQKEESYSDSIVSILSNLDALKNVYFIITTRDYENILNKFKKNSFILDISSKEYIKNIDDDVSSFIKLNINKNLIFESDKNNLEKERIVDQLAEKAQGNFLYIKFVMDAVLEKKKFDFPMEDIDKKIFSIYEMYNLFFDRMVFQYGKNNWNLHYVPALKSLLDNPEGIDLEQMASLTEIQRHELHQVLLNLKPFIVVLEEPNSSKRKYKLYHQSLNEFLKKEYLDNGSPNVFYISERY